MSQQQLDELEARFVKIIDELYSLRNTRGDVDGRSISLAITNVETGRLWFKYGVKDAGGGEPLSD